MQIGLPGTLILVRHGRTPRNEAKKGDIFFKDAAARDAVRGMSDRLTPLTEAGADQAIRTGVAFRDRFGVPDEIIHSGYLRTEHTGLHLLQAYTPEERARISFRRDERIRERQLGWTYDMTEDEVRQHFPWFEEHRKTFGPYDTVPPGGECLATLVDRVGPFYQDLRRGPAGRFTVAVSHGNTIRGIRSHVEGLTPDQMIKMRWPPNCGIVVYTFDERGVPTLVSENEVLCEK